MYNEQMRQQELINQLTKKVSDLTTELDWARLQIEDLKEQLNKDYEKKLQNKRIILKHEGMTPNGPASRIVSIS